MYFEMRTIQPKIPKNFSIFLWSNGNAFVNLSPFLFEHEASVKIERNETRGGKKKKKCAFPGNSQGLRGPLTVAKGKRKTFSLTFRHILSFQHYLFRCKFLRFVAQPQYLRHLIRPTMQQITALLKWQDLGMSQLGLYTLLISFG